MGLGFCLCLVTFWGDPIQILLFGIMFAVAIWYGGDKTDQRVSPRINAMISGTILLFLVVLILVYKLGDYPVITALIALAFGSTMMYSKYLAQTETLKEVEQHADGDAEETV